LDVSSDLPLQLQRDVIQIWKDKGLYEIGRITEVDVASSCAANFAPIKSVSWGNLAYICRQNHEMLLIVARCSFSHDTTVALLPFVGAVRSRVLLLRRMLNEHVSQLANKVRCFLYETSTGLSSESDGQNARIRLLCEHAMYLGRICSHVHALEMHFPSARLPLPDAMSVLASYREAITKAKVAHRRGWDKLIVHMEHARIVCCDNKTELHIQSASLHNQHTHLTQQFYMTKNLLTDKKKMLKHKLAYICQLQCRIDEALLIQHELGQTSWQTSCDAPVHTSVHAMVHDDASGCCYVQSHEGDCGDLHKKVETQLQVSVLTSEIDELEKTILENIANDDEDAPLHVVMKQCSDASSQLRTVEEQISVETARKRCIDLLADEALWRVRTELERPDHLCRPMVSGTLRASVQNPLYNHHWTLCRVQVVLCQVKYLKHVSVSVKSLQWVDSSNRFWPNSFILNPKPLSEEHTRITKQQLTRINAFEHAAVLMFYLPVSTDRRVSTIRSAVLDFKVSLCFHDIVSQKERHISSRHVTSTSICIKPSVTRQHIGIFKPACVFLTMMVLRFITKTQVRVTPWSR
jgi:hypothetical protein